MKRPEKYNEVQWEKKIREFVDDKMRKVEREEEDRREEQEDGPEGG